jgi:(4S)-4-hydroxy-5-phosphonooxypentane-2,3-dione isomerase
MSKIALVVEFHLKPGRREDFLAHMREHAAATLANVEGCLQFDVLVPREIQFDVPVHQPDNSRVFLYEMYRDEEVLQTHLKSPRVAKTRAGYADMVESRKITRCAVQ